MHRPRTCWLLLGIILALVAVHLCLPLADSACCYFSAKNTDILQPAQKVFITWNPNDQLETFTVQPKFEGNALDFGMVIPTPSQPKLHEMPRDFFKHLAVYTIMKRRESPYSKLLPSGVIYSLGRGGEQPMQQRLAETRSKPGDKPTVVVREAGVVGSLDYK